MGRNILFLFFLFTGNVDATTTSELADEIVSKGTEEERTQLLAENPDLIDADLAKEILARGVAKRRQGNYDDALSLFDLARRISEQLQDASGIAAYWNETATIHRLRGNYKEALEQFERAMIIGKDLNDKAIIANTLSGKGIIFDYTGDSRAALSSFQEALRLFEELGDQRRVASMMNSIGIILSNDAEYEEALKYYSKSLQICELIGEKEGISAALLNIGAIYAERGEYRFALEKYRQSLAIKEEIGEAAGISRALNNLGIVYFRSGDYRAAIEAFQKSLVLKEQLKDRAGISQTYTNMSNYFAEIGDYDLSLHYAEKALAIKKEIGEARGIATLYMNQGDAFQRKKDLRHAVEHYEKSLKQTQDSGYSDLKAAVLARLCAFATSQKGLEESLRYCDESLAQSKRTNSKIDLVRALEAKASVLADNGKEESALILATEAAVKSQEESYPQDLIQLFTFMGTIHLKQGRLGEAESEFNKAIQEIETLRFDIPGAERESQLFFEDQISPYHGMVQVMKSTGKLEEALQYAERARARTLLDVLQKGRVRIEKNMTEVERSEEQEMRIRLVSLNLRMRAENQKEKPDLTLLKKMNSQVSQGRLEWNAFRAKLYSAHPELGILRGEVQVSIPIPSEESRTVYLEYLVTSESTYLFVLTAGKPLTIHMIHGGREYWRNQSAEFRKTLALRDLGFRKGSMELYQALLAPALGKLEGKNELVIVPDGGLWELPFAALLNKEGRYLIEEFAISYVPSLTLLSELKKNRVESREKRLSFYASANPELGTMNAERLTEVFGAGTLESLPETEREVLQLAKYYGPDRSTVRIGKEAREDLIKKEVGNFDVVHLAAHGILNDASPMYSFLLLSGAPDGREDGFLEAWEIMDMDWKARIVVLSACDTARGRIAPGEGVVGLSWALFVSGVPTSLVSLWKVDSAGTTQLMLEFHKNLASQKITASASIQKAALKLLRSEHHRHPFFWAGFVLIGNSE